MIWLRYQRAISLETQVGVKSQINKWANTDVTVWESMSVYLQKVDGLSPNTLYNVSGFSLPLIKTDCHDIVEYGEKNTNKRTPDLPDIVHVHLTDLKLSYTTNSYTKYWLLGNFSNHSLGQAKLKQMLWLLKIYYASIISIPKNIIRLQFREMEKDRITTFSPTIRGEYDVLQMCIMSQ
jgi:hypothetical protein